ncbi:MAG: hypothetical protein ACXWUG_09600 [Polyangiales bacterium]
MAKKSPLPIASEVKRWRPIGSLPRGSAPLGVSASAPFDGTLSPGDAIWCAPDVRDAESPAALESLLPEPLPGALVFVAPSVAKPGLFARLTGGETKIPRAVRGSALLLRGYRDVAGGLDPASGLDLAWARA